MSSETAEERKLKVLLCNKFYRPIGGPENVLSHTMSELKALGHIPIPFAMSHPDNWKSEYSDYFVSDVDYSTKKSKGAGLVNEALNIIYSREARRNIDRLIRDTKPDVAHAHNIYHQLSPSILVALKKAGVPTILSLHDGKLLCANMLFLRDGQVCEQCGGRWFYHAVQHKCVQGSVASSLLCCVEETIHRLMGIYERNVDLFIAPSYFFKQKMVEYGRLKEDQIVVLHTYGNTTSISPNYIPGDYGLYLGKVEVFKGVRTLVQACKQIPEFEVRIAGRGDFYEEGLKMCETEGISNAKFLGFQYYDDVVRLVTDSRFVVVPSEWYENCPMTVLEGLSAGKPVIAANIGGIPELIEHGVDGLLYEPGDMEGLAAAMRQLIDNPELAREMGMRGRAKVEERYSMEIYMKSLVDIYRKVANLS